MKTSNMINNCDKFKALVPKVIEYTESIAGKYSDPEFYLFDYNKISKTITIYNIVINKTMVDGKLFVKADWKHYTYRSERSALNKLRQCLKDIKEFYNLYRVTQANEDF